MDMTTKEWIKKAGLTAKRHLTEDGSHLKGMSVHDATGQKMHTAPYCTAEGATKIAQQALASRD